LTFHISRQVSSIKLLITDMFRKKVNKCI